MTHTAVGDQPTDTVDPPDPRLGSVARRAGYLIVVMINGVIWYLVNGHPTWHAVPFLTADFRAVLPFFNSLVIVTILLNLGYTAYDPRWVTTVGAVVTWATGLALMADLLRVFPFDFPPQPPLDSIVRVALILGILTGVIGLLLRVVWLATVGLAGRDTRRP